jgi:hypothetical protein
MLYEHWVSTGCAPRGDIYSKKKQARENLRSLDISSLLLPYDPDRFRIRGQHEQLYPIGAFI